MCSIDLSSFETAFFFHGLVWLKKVVFYQHISYVFVMDWFDFKKIFLRHVVFNFLISVMNWFSLKQVVHQHKVFSFFIFIMVLFKEHI